MTKAQRQYIQDQILQAGRHPMIDVYLGDSSKHVVSARITVGNKPVYKIFTDMFKNPNMEKTNLSAYNLILN